MAASIAPCLSRLSAFPSQQDAQDAPPLQLNPGPERVAHDDGSERPKVYQRRKKGSPATEEAAAEVARPDSSEEVDQVSSGEKTCVECSTSRTPLWRRGPAGPKSLCNACGLRYKKRSRERSFNPTQMKANALTKEKEQSQGKDVFFLHRKFAGTEEAEAATLLMALSCGVSFLF